MKQTQVTPLIQHPNGDTLTPESIRADVQAMLNTTNDLAARIEILKRENAAHLAAIGEMATTILDLNRDKRELVGALKPFLQLIGSDAGTSARVAKRLLLSACPEYTSYLVSANAILSRMEASK